MVMMTGIEIPMAAIREYIASALSIIIHLTRLQDGSRRVTSVSEIVGMEGSIITLQEIFKFDFSAGVDEAGRPQGQIRATGIRPLFADRLRDLGVNLPAAIFEPGGEAG
jgi:pilus assembly protein CpaF